MRTSIFRELGLGFFAIATLALMGTGQAAAAEEPDHEKYYAAKATWAETMHATRERYADWLDSGEPDRGDMLGPWYATGPIEARNARQTHVRPEELDLEAKDGDGKPLWRRQPEWQNGKPHMLPGGERVATYLFRTITVPEARQFHVGLGSDDGLQVWLNGKSVLNRKGERELVPNQDALNLALEAGENQLLMRVFNRDGDHGFFFSTREDPAGYLWRRITRDFSSEAAHMQRDSGRGTHIAWFREAGKTELEERITASVLDQIGEAASKLRSQFEALKAEKTPSSAPSWLNLYEETADARDRVEALRTRLATVDCEAMRRAIRDLAASFPEQYTKAGDYLRAVADCEKSLADVEHVLLEDEAEATRRVDIVLAVQRKALLANPLLDFERVLVVKRKGGRDGLPANWQGNCAMARTGYENEIAVLSEYKKEVQLTTLYGPEDTEFVGDVDLHFDARKMLFSMPGSHGRWQVWEIGVDGTGLRQVTPGEHPDVDNYDACYLPDERIMFDSTRCFQGVPCVGGGNTVANLCVMDENGRAIRQLCFDQDHNWCPTVMNNGRVLYTRWEYSDTPHYFTRLLFSMNPDGTNQMAYYGSNSYWPNSMFYTRPIPGHPTKVVTIVSGHHGVRRMGEMVILDPARGRHEADGAVQRIPGWGKKVEPIIADALVNNSWPKFLHPYPLSDKYFLVASMPTPRSLWGVYLVDVFDNMVLLKEEPGWQIFEPVPLRSTPRPPRLPDKVNLASSEATIYLTDVYMGEGMAGVPRGAVKKLRLFEFHYAYPQMGGHKHIAIEGTWDVHRILGTVPVEPDGSALFTVPANTPIAVQPLDAEGRAMQVMRSWFSAMPGETLSCSGCHEQQNTTPAPRHTLAARRVPSSIEPWHGPTRGFSFKRELQQPVLEKYCVGCHNGQQRADGKQLADFSVKEKQGWGNFTPAYIALHPYVRRPGPESDYHMEKPMEYHADTSELVQMLKKGHHGVRLDAEAWDRLYTWIDLNVPDHGTWTEHRKIASNFHERRMEMRTRYANRPEDPEYIPEIPREPVAFTTPDPIAAAADAALADWPLDAEKAKQRQSTLGEKTRRTVDLGGGLTMEFTLVPAGGFRMGSAAGYADETPPTSVAIDKPFWLGVTEVTNEQFLRFNPRHDNGYFDQHHKDHTTPGYSAHGLELPVMRVTWEEAVAFAAWLSERTGLTCALPTEAQWEWACRAGTATPFHFGGVDSDFSRFANLADLSIKRLAVSGVNPQPIGNPSPYEDFVPKDTRFDDGVTHMASAGNYEPNAWGLRDMHGNVAEWTLSVFRPYPYQGDDGRNGLDAQGRRVVRGGSWFDRPHRARSSFRLGYEPWQRVHNVGFRVAIEADADPRKVVQAAASK